MHYYLKNSGIMPLEEIIEKLKEDKNLYGLALIYSLVKDGDKKYLLELYKEGNDEDVCNAIKNAIYADKETMNTVKAIIDAQKYEKGDIPSFKTTSEIIKRQMSELDSNDIKEFIKKNKKWFCKYIIFENFEKIIN